MKMRGDYMSIIEIKNLTKDFGNAKGIFDVSFNVEKGEVFGFIGPNGAGKTTTIRHLMGFITQDNGKCTINGLDCKKEADQIQKVLGYLPGEIAFMNDMTGIQFIHFVAKLKKCKDLTIAKELMKRFDLDPSGKIRKMSKGMKQKIGIVCAFMNNPEILVLDEPTSGLDPLMQSHFIDLILEAKAKGKTILMSSHVFEEVEKTCDRFAMIKDGKIITIQNTGEFHHEKKKNFIITFINEAHANDFMKYFPLAVRDKNVVTITTEGEITELIRGLYRYRITDIEAITPTLEESFMHLYGGEKND